jgi:hypothetical protein
VTQADGALYEQPLVVRPSMVQHVPHSPQPLRVYGCAVKIEDGYNSTHGCKILPVGALSVQKRLETDAETWKHH